MTSTVLLDAGTEAKMATKDPLERLLLNWERHKTAARGGEGVDAVAARAAEALNREEGWQVIVSQPVLLAMTRRDFVDGEPRASLLAGGRLLIVQMVKGGAQFVVLTKAGIQGFGVSHAAFPTCSEAIAHARVVALAVARSVAVG